MSGVTYAPDGEREAPHPAGPVPAAAGVQLTLTTFFAGMGLGQLVGGPVSDQRGRRRPLLVAIVLMTLASVACAVAPTISIMMVARFVQGFTGGWAMVVGRGDRRPGDRRPAGPGAQRDRRGRRHRADRRTAAGRGDPAAHTLAGLVLGPRSSC